MLIGEIPWGRRGSFGRLFANSRATCRSGRTWTRQDCIAKQARRWRASKRASYRPGCAFTAHARRQWNSVFERYTEKARRVIFFARYEASQYGSQHIETEHLLLGLMREDNQLLGELRGRGATEETIRNWIALKVTLGPKGSTTGDMP